MPAAYHSAPVVRCHSVQAGTATVVKAANSIAARNSWPHMRIEWKTVWPPRSVLPPMPRMRVLPQIACITAGRRSWAGGPAKRSRPEGGRCRGFPFPVPPLCSEDMNMRRTFTDSRAAWCAPAIVLSPLALAALATGAGADAALLGPLWLAALAWTAAASLAGALSQGVRRRDWSAFRRHRLPDGADDRPRHGHQDGHVRVSARGGGPPAPRRLTLTGPPAGSRPRSRGGVPPASLVLRRPVSASTPGGRVGDGVFRSAVELAGEPVADHRQVLRRLLLEGLVPLDRHPGAALR